MLHSGTAGCRACQLWELTVVHRLMGNAALQSGCQHVTLVVPRVAGNKRGNMDIVWYCCMHQGLGTTATAEGNRHVALLVGDTWLAVKVPRMALLALKWPT